MPAPVPIKPPALSQPAMITNVGRIGWLLAIVQNNPIILVGVAGATPTARCRISDSQRAALESWAQEYRGDLGIALSDVVGFKAFLRDFDLYFAKLFDGCQNDSGDAVSWCVNLIEHYDKLGIDPKTKSAVFTDGVDFEKAVELHQTFFEMINLSFGIGTILTNNMGFTPPEIAINMIECNGQPVAMICDSEDRVMCEDPEFLSYLKKAYKIK